MQAVIFVGDLAYADNYVSPLAPPLRMALRAALRRPLVSWETGVSICTSAYRLLAQLLSSCTHATADQYIPWYHSMLTQTHLYRCTCLTGVRQDALVYLCMRPCRTTREVTPTLDLLCPQQCPPTMPEPTSTKARPSSLAGVSLNCLCRAMSILAASLESQSCWYQACQPGVNPSLILSTNYAGSSVHQAQDFSLAVVTSFCL